MNARKPEGFQPSMEVPEPPQTKEDSDARGVYNDFMKAGDKINDAAARMEAQRAQYDAIQAKMNAPKVVKSAWQRGMDAIGAKMAELKKKTMEAVTGVKQDAFEEMMTNPAFDVPKKFDDADNDFFAKGDRMNSEAAERAQYDSMQKKIKAQENRNTKPASELTGDFKEMMDSPDWQIKPAAETTEESKDDKAAA